MKVALVYEPRTAEYRFPEGHPMRPERFTLAVSLMRAWRLLELPDHLPDAAKSARRAAVWSPAPARESDILRVHSAAYVEALKAADAAPHAADPAFGLGPGDTPAFRGIYEASRIAVGATVLALDAVLDGRAQRTFNPAGGLHHAMRDRAAGFCTLNDCAIAIERAIAAAPGLRVAYVDIDAHHGDGVEAAFRDRPDVLTVSVHESGRYLFPGTGAARDVGEGPGLGYALNVGLPPYAGARDMLAALDEVVVPAVRSFHPDVIVAQLGADSHRNDPLTHLDNTIEGYTRLVARIADLAERTCGGRLAATGGGGYQPFSAVPRMWAGAMAVLLGTPVPTTVPAEWLAEANAAAGIADAAGTSATFDDGPEIADEQQRATAHTLTLHAIAESRAASPLLGATDTVS